MCFVQYWYSLFQSAFFYSGYMPSFGCPPTTFFEDLLYKPRVVVNIGFSKGGCCGDNYVIEMIVFKFDSLTTVTEAWENWIS